MDNFDFKKYLAEGKLHEEGEPNPLEMEAQKLIDELGVMVAPDGGDMMVYPNSKPGDRFYDSRSAQKFRLAVNNGQLFGNSIYVGANTINGQVFYTLLILPEALFNGTPLATTNNTLAIYSTVNTLFYIITSANSSSQFVPSSASITSTSTSGTNTIVPTYNISKLILSVSNVPII